MDSSRAFLAILLSLIVLVLYQYLFVPPAQPPAPTEEVAPQSQTRPAPPVIEEQSAAAPQTAAIPEVKEVVPPPGADIPVETNLYSAVVSKVGGGVRSFKLKEYKEQLGAEADNKQLVSTELARELPLFFSWGLTPEQAPLPEFTADAEALSPIGQESSRTLTLRSTLPSGLEMIRTLEFNNADYRIGLSVKIVNPTDQPVQGAPFLSLTSSVPVEQQYTFAGPALYLNGSLLEVKPDKLAKGRQTHSGTVSWAAYEDNYFMSGVIPQEKEGVTAELALKGEDKISVVLTRAADTISAGSTRQYDYAVYFGPKEIETLRAMDSDLDKIINFGWFDVLAKPTLSLLNLLERFTRNYGVAIILVTVLIKLLFWPISQKGMESMKNMQKIQPKMAKLREKYKDDHERLNREMMTLYRTYKVNPLGGCLPMLLQVPVFFALYKVLLQSIELRHAPFMLWIRDLSAPDRLPIGIDIPYLGGIPVLTLLMGASMFLQQKMSPTSADPTQAKIMMFLPVIFTFMFVNFASGLVLYWFTNNLLAIGQQYLINRRTTG